MSLWQFSESSIPLLRRIESITTDKSNKWNEKFGSKARHFERNDEISNTVIANSHPNSYIEDIAITNSNIVSMDIDEAPIGDILEKEDFRREILEMEPIADFDFFVEKCLENTSLYPLLAKELPIDSIEKLCKHIYVTKNINPIFLESFYTIFFSAFLKREPTRLSMDLLVKAKCYSVYFKHLLVIIAKDTELPNTMFYDIVSTLNNNEQTDFLVTLCQFDIPKEVFMYHLTSFNTVYRNSQKNNEIQNYILTKLTQVSEGCITDKNYGSFLLNFLQSHKKYDTNILGIENIVNIHRSVFKKRCLNVLNEIKKLA